MSINVDKFEDLPNPVRISCSPDKNPIIAYRDFCNQNGIEMYHSFMDTKDDEKYDVYFGFEKKDHAVLFKMKVA